jgi:dihydroflavonol-4-reductase
MELDERFWVDKRVCVTGGTGFLGWHIVQDLLAHDCRVRVLGLLPRSPVLRALLNLTDFVAGDVRDPAAVRRALDGCDLVFHAAGTTSTWGQELKELREVHVGGTRRVLEALPAGARLVHTSSVVAVGATLQPMVLTEDSAFDLNWLSVDYVHAKRAAEVVALSAAAQGLDVTIVNPAYLVGPEDYNRSVMGRFCQRAWRHRIPVVPRGGFNCVDVRDVARGHLLAAERATSGRRYILGGENLSLLDLTRQLTKQRRRSGRWLFRIPSWLHLALGWCAELIGSHKRHGPHSTVQESRIANLFWFYSDERARKELGYRPRPLQETLRDTHDWASQNHRLKPLQESTSERSLATCYTPHRIPAPRDEIDSTYRVAATSRRD